MIERYPLSVLVFATCGTMPGWAHAAESPSVPAPAEVVISATRSERTVDSVPASASVLTAETLEARTFDRLDEALNTEAGLYDGRVRGTSSTSHTLIMLNGMPLNSGWYGGVNWQNVAMENVERVEIVRGPGSSLYGGNAMGGTINVITKLPRQLEASVGTRMGSDDYASYHASIGNLLFDRLAVRLGGEYDDEIVGRPVDYVFRPVTTGTGTLNGGSPSLNRAGRSFWIVGDKGDRKERQWNVNLSADYRLSETGSLRLDAQEGYATYRNGRPNSYVNDASAQPAFSGSVNTGTNQRVTLDPGLFLSSDGMDENSAYMLTYADEIASARLVAKLGYQNEDKWYTSVTANSGNYDTARGNLREFNTDTYFVDIQATKPLGERNTLIAGVYARENGFDQAQHDLALFRDERSIVGGVTELTQGTDRYYAAYLQDELAITDAVKMFIGARYDKWEAYDGLSGPAASPLTLADTKDSAFSPSAAWVWQVSQATVLRASVAKAFSAPTIYDRYRTFVSNNQLTLSNPNLASESLVNYEIGVVQYLWDARVRAGLTAFLMEYEDLVYSYTFDDVNDIDGNPLTTIVSSNANAAEARNRGFELTLQYQPAQWLSLWANYSENHTKIRRNPLAPATVGKHFTFSPDRGSSVGTDVRYRWLQASVNATYTGRIFRTADNSDLIKGVYQSDSVGWLADLKLSADIPKKMAGTGTTTVALSVRNLFDREYFEYFIGRPRSYYLELGLKF